MDLNLKHLLNKYINFHTCCIPAKGYRRSLLIDYQRADLQYIPNDLVNIILYNRNKQIKEVYNELDEDDKKTYLEYIEFLLEKEFIILLDEEELDFFPLLNNEFDFPGKISNAILEFRNEPKFNLDLLVNQLNELGCVGISLVIYYEMSFTTLKEMIFKFEGSSIESIEIHLNYNDSFTKEVILNIVKDCFRISIINFYNINGPLLTTNIFSQVNYSKNELTSFTQCGEVGIKHFTINLPFITETMNFNSCLYRKVTVNSEGLVKNCPIIQNDYGNILDEPLEKIINKEEFRSLWHIRKDDIDVCKDCEYRYICPDCRAIIKNKNNLYSQPKKCKYNPYIGTWKNEEGWISVDNWRLNNNSIE